MTVGRNDPCPCGSGKKYKNCCLVAERDAGVEGLIPPQARALAVRLPVWEVDVLPLGIGFRDDPAARPTLALVVAGDVILHAVPHARSPSEPEDIAASLEAALLAAGCVVGTLPAEVRVRHEEVAEPLRPLLTPRDVAVAAAPHLDAVDAVFRDLGPRLTGRDVNTRASSAEMWAGWGLPAELVAEIFRAGAEFYRAAPWTWLTNLQLLDAEPPDGRRWAACILGNAGQEFGLALYSEPEDFWSGVGAEDADDFFGDVAGRILSLTFDPPASLPQAMRKEVAAAGWEVAGPEAYPVLFVVNTPGGGISRRDATDLARVLRSVARLSEQHGAALAAGREVQWRDPETGPAWLTNT